MSRAPLVRGPPLGGRRLGDHSEAVPAPALAPHRWRPGPWRRPSEAVLPGDRPPVRARMATRTAARAAQCTASSAIASGRRGPGTGPPRGTGRASPRPGSSDPARRSAPRRRPSGTRLTTTCGDSVARPGQRPGRHRPGALGARAQWRRRVPPPGLRSPGRGTASGPHRRPGGGDGGAARPGPQRRPGAVAVVSRPGRPGAGARAAPPGRERPEAVAEVAELVDGVVVVRRAFTRRPRPGLLPRRPA